MNLGVKRLNVLLRVGAEQEIVHLCLQEEKGDDIEEHIQFFYMNIITIKYPRNFISLLYT